MLGELGDLAQISSISGPYKGETEFDLESPLAEAPVPSDAKDMLFVGRFCEVIVVCAGKVLKYEEHRSDFATLVIKGAYVSFAEAALRKQ